MLPPVGGGLLLVFAVVQHVHTTDLAPLVHDGRVYLAYLNWGNPNLTYVRLNTDMTSYSGSPTHQEPSA
ncbi:hypothetical protein OG426_50020 [Streptomyces canus]|uniref:hypothetical protein n=1 Tax=Streptomyces canus TaxID=58343 RepID=UPI0038689045|nr:hypothetical protein OG426_50020 [Streptomyces canus]